MIPNDVAEFKKWLFVLDARDIGIYASGGYGLEKKQVFITMLKAAIK